MITTKFKQIKFDDKAMQARFEASAARLSDEELQRHAYIGRRLCKCNGCFCCIAAAEQDARAKERSA